ncbi:AT-rich binding protein-like [Culex pipiens pallens]|uniref:AT-rich binding protein-like n=1 Tax=Culex pipiens pallens TaxID=42434 RepID=UPI0019547E1D|nr:AT-rich binding protein-like [Culex pipiens pallens]
MNGQQEFPTSIARNSPKHEFPQQQSSSDFQHFQQQSGMHGGYPPGIPTGTPPPPQSAQQQDLTIDGIPNSGGGGGPFPHRRSRASRTFKNPPQPHMCIREKTIDGKEVYINVLSWTRIANPDNPDAPIPLYGGMKVGKIPPGSPRAPPLVYAVMASPEVLKKAGRKCPDTPERMNLVDLMCEFVEAMNPTLHLSRKPEILKDRDLSGELKDVWSAVQACRDKGRVDSGPPENLVVYTEFGPETAPSYEQSQHQQQQQYHHQQHFPHQHQQQYQQQQQQQNQHYGGEPFQYHQQQPQNHHQQQQPQSAITNDVNSSDSPDVPDCGVSDQQLEELCQEADALKLAPATKTNGLTLPTTTTSPSGSAESTPATSPSSSSSTTTNPESNPVPAASAAASAPQQGNSTSSTSPTSPTTTTSTTPVSPTTVTTTPSPATPQKESKNTSHFFPMFRSSKSSSSSEKSADKDHANSSSSGGSSSGDQVDAQPDTPVKSSSKKSGLNFFRRNKTESKKSAEPPVTPTKQKDAAAAEGKERNLLDKLDESLLHHHHHHGGSNGTGEIIENSSATIVAK